MKVSQKVAIAAVFPAGIWVIIGGLSYGAAAPDVHPFLKHMADSTAAGWVQAFGSVAAILWGVFLYQRDADRRRDDVKRRETTFGDSFTEVVSLVTAQARGAERISEHHDLRDGEFTEVTFDRLRFADQLISGFSGQALAEARLAHEAISVRTKIGQLSRRCADFNKLIRDGNSDAQQKALNQVRLSISRLRQQLEGEEAALRREYPGAQTVELVN